MPQEHRPISQDRIAVEPLPPEELEQVPEHLDDEPAPAPAGPGGPLRFARMTGSSIAGRVGAAWVTGFPTASPAVPPSTPSGARGTSSA